MATARKGVDREFYEDAVRQRDLALERARTAEDRLAVVVKELVDLKRHDVDAPPRASFSAESLDPLNGLGPRTIMAIEEFAGGDVELRGKLVARAHVLRATAQAEDPGAGSHDIDRYVAHIIEEGDTG